MKFNKLYNLIEGVFEPASDKDVVNRKEEYNDIQIHDWFDNFTSYDRVTQNPDESYDVIGNVDINEMGLTTKLPIKFNTVSGSFYCIDNQLTSLEGMPEWVGGYFDCSYNQLTSLTGAPKYVGGHFDCSFNINKFTEEDVRAVCDVKGNIIV